MDAALGRLCRCVVTVLAAAVLAPLPACAAAYEVAYHDVPERISADGVVEAVRQSTLAAQVAGQVVELNVRAGDRVRAGQVLARLDARTALQAAAGSQSQLAEAQAQLGNALRSYERSKQLAEQKFISKAGLDQAELDYKAAQARVGALQAGAAQARTAATFTTISAPYAGVVGATSVEVGDMASPGRALFTVFDPAALRVLVTLPQSSLVNVRPGLPVQIELAGAPAGLTATRVTVLPLADSRSHTVKLRLDLADGAGLQPGQFARAIFPGASSRKLVIPRQAVLRRSEVTAVYVLGAAGQPQLRQVRLGEATADGCVEVLAGLGAGERVATDPVRAGLQPALLP